MQIIIAGYGYVGKAVANALQEDNTIHIVDPKYTTGEIAHAPLADGIIICVGTPGDQIGACDDRHVREVLTLAPSHIPVLIKSTVTPDRLEKLIQDFPNHSICYSPEFLTAANADLDFARQEFMVIGGTDPGQFWQVLFQTSLPNLTIIFNCSYTEASMVKYTINSFLATKVSFFNQIYDMCQANGANYNLVRKVVTHDKRIGISHTQVPGLDNERGFGGMCLPKDTNAFIHYSDHTGTMLPILESAIKYNKKTRKKH